MRSLLKCFVVGLAAFVLAASLRAEEKGSSVISALSSSVLSGYVDTSVQWNVGSNNSPNVHPAYLQWLIGKRQTALNACRQEYVATHDYWGNAALFQARLSHYRLVWVSGQIPVPIVTALSGGTYPGSSGYAYFDPPSVLAGPGGTYLMPDLSVVRMPARGFGFPR